MYQDNMLEMLSKIENEDRERRFKHRRHQEWLDKPAPAKRGTRFLAFVAGLTNRLSATNEPVTLQKRATSEVPGV